MGGAMTALLVAWGALIVAVIGRAILETRPPLETDAENAAAVEDLAEEEPTLMDVIARSYF
jgi:hypothetical protein